MMEASGFSRQASDARPWEGKDTFPFQWAGFNVRFGTRAVQAVHIEKLAGFVRDLNGLRDPLRACAQALARELHSSKVVYGPDCFSPFGRVHGVEDGVSLDEILSDARQLCGEPVGSIREMADQDEDLNLDRRCYFVEPIE